MNVPVTSMVRRRRSPPSPMTAATWRFVSRSRNSAVLAVRATIGAQAGGSGPSPAGGSAAGHPVGSAGPPSADTRGSVSPSGRGWLSVPGAPPLPGTLATGPPGRDVVPRRAASLGLRSGGGGTWCPGIGRVPDTGGPGSRFGAQGGKTVPCIPCPVPVATSGVIGPNGRAITGGPVVPPGTAP